MADINLKSLNLEAKYPELARLQSEVRELEKNVRKAETDVSQLRAELPSARERDLDLQAKALRAGGKVPESKHEQEVERKLEAATRKRDVASRALQSAQHDLSVLLQRHQGDLYRDVLQSRAEIAREAATAARKALQAYSRYEDLYYLLKDLQPPPEAPEVGPAKNTNSYIGIHTTRSQGPARGEIEGALSYIVSLGAGPVQGDSDAA